MNRARNVALVTALSLVMSILTSAQSGLGQIGPSNAEVAGAAVGLAAVTGVVLYLTLHKTSITGCLRSEEGTNILTNETDKLTYKLVDGPNLNPGERVKLQGKKERDKSGNLSFRVKKLSRDLGPCPM